VFDNNNENNHRGGRRFARLAPRGPHGHGGRGGFGPGFGPFGPGFGPGGPGGPGKRFRARRGDVRLVVLSLLGEKESNGYGLIQAIAERTEDRWRPSPGSVYPTLQQLVDEGLIAGAGGGDVYRLTDEGRAYIAEHADAITAAWDGLPGQDAQTDELWESFMKLAKATRQFHSEANDEQRKRIATRFDELRREIYGTLAE